MKKDLNIIPKSFTVSFSSILPQRGLWPFSGVTLYWGKGNNQTFWGLLDTGSDCGPPGKVGTSGGQVTDGVSAKSGS